MRIAVIGAGSFGTALAHLLGNKEHAVRLWAHNPAVVQGIAQKHENPVYMKGLVLPASVTATGDLATALERAELVVFASPSHVTRDVMVKALPHLPRGVPIVSATKGIENDTLMTMSEVLEDVLPPEHHPYLAYLSGPSFAAEVAQQKPTVVVIASHWDRIARVAQQAFACKYFRAYTSSDVPGVELGGALKNVIAIAAGVSDGMKLGSNTRAAIITRGLAEIGRIAVRKGANPMTLSGLAGVGDLVLTCTGALSRNRSVGVSIGEGKKLSQILESMQEVAEGVKTCRAARDLAQKLGVEAPLTDAVYRMLYEDLPAPQALVELMGRELKPEF